VAGWSYVRLTGEVTKRKDPNIEFLQQQNKAVDQLGRPPFDV